MKKSNYRIFSIMHMIGKIEIIIFFVWLFVILIFYDQHLNYESEILGLSKLFFSSIIGKIILALGIFPIMVTLIKIYHNEKKFQKQLD